jgi:hypothetical protein
MVTAICEPADGPGDRGRRLSCSAVDTRTKILYFGAS